VKIEKEANCETRGVGDQLVAFEEPPALVVLVRFSLIPSALDFIALKNKRRSA